MAIPKGGFFEDKVEQGRYGPIYPTTPACYGFSIVAKVIPGREEAFYKFAKDIENTIAAQPDALAILQLHYLRWVLFPVKGDTYFMYQGIFDTDFDKYTEDAVSLFGITGLRTAFENLEGFPADWQTNPAAFVRLVRDHQCPSFLEYAGYPRVSAEEIKTSPHTESRVLHHAGPDAIILRHADCRTGHLCDAELTVTGCEVSRMGNIVMLEFDDIQHVPLTRAPALTGRCEFLSFRDGAGGRAWASAIKGKIHSAESMQAGVDEDKRWATVAFTWNGLRALGLDQDSLASFPEDRSHPFIAEGNREFNFLVDGTERAKVRKHHSGRFHEFHHTLWWHGESRDLLEESRGDEMSGGLWQ